MNNLARRSCQVAPLLIALALLTLVPQIAIAPLSGILFVPWRLDALTLIFVVSLCLGVALPALHSPAASLPSWRAILLALARLAFLIPALLVEHLLGLPLALLVVGVLLRNWRWGAAASVLLCGLLLLRMAGARSWYEPQLLAALTSPVFLLLITSACAGLPCYPAALVNEQPRTEQLMLQPIWLLALLRTFSWGPWNSGWIVAVVLIGGATTVWSASIALWTDSERERVERVAGVWLGMALACVGLATPVGIASALWLVVVYPLGLALILPVQRNSSRLWAAPVPPSAIFVGCWLALAASAASGAFLLSAMIWFASLIYGLALLKNTPRSGNSWSGAPVLLLVLLLAIGVLAPLPLRWLIMPAVELLQGGLTPFGLLNIWPWVGIAALDAGQRRVAVWPSIAVTALTLVGAALVWLLARLLGWPAPVVEEHDNSEPGVWTELRNHVWWARGTGRRG
jgi:hypothetical protein